MNRREALTTLASIGVALNTAGAQTGGTIYRTLGKTGEKVSAIGVGGAHAGMAASADITTRIIRTAIDHGVNFMDNSWDYIQGECERRMGVALRDGYRQKVFLMTKFDGRTKQSAAKQIDESLQRLQTDHVDLNQFHETARMDDADAFFAQGGALEAVLEAKKAGKIRYIGFTGHKDPLVHLRMLDVAAQHNFHFDACQMPLNVLDYSFRSFAHLVVPKLVEQGIGVLGMKPMAFGAIPANKIATGIECLHYAMNLPTSVVITGMETMDRLNQALEAMRTFRPMSEEEVTRLVTRTKAAAMTGKFEEFKTGHRFDQTYLHPDWLGWA